MCNRRWKLDGLFRPFCLTFITGDSPMDKRWRSSKTPIILPLLLFWGALWHSRRSVKQKKFDLLKLNCIWLFWSSRLLNLSPQCLISTVCALQSDWDNMYGLEWSSPEMPTCSEWCLQGEQFKLVIQYCWGLWSTFRNFLEFFNMIMKFIFVL